MKGEKNRLDDGEDLQRLAPGVFGEGWQCPVCEERTLAKSLLASPLPRLPWRGTHKDVWSWAGTSAVVVASAATLPSLGRQQTKVWALEFRIGWEVRGSRLAETGALLYVVCWLGLVVLAAKAQILSFAGAKVSTTHTARHGAPKVNQGVFALTYVLRLN
jgi:hypothetical protein